LKLTQDKGLNLGAQLLGGITEPFRHDGAVPLGPRTSEHTGNFHKSTPRFSFEKNLLVKLT
jgi:hypothetical protein